jgi:pyruvate dehydrogenase E2 component (dihydrolipoamide acetyltransferase)
MIQQVRLPDISENVETGDVIKILVSTGDVVEIDQPLLELETDKAVLEVPSPYKGKVTEILVKTGETIKVGQTIMKIETADATVGTGAASTVVAGNVSRTAARSTAPPGDATIPGAAPAEGPVSIEEEEPPPASPGVRRLARELGVDLHKVKGSGEGGRISQEDVKRFAKELVGGAPASSEPQIQARPAETSTWGPVVREPMSKVRQVTARTLTQAWTTIPHVTHYDRADITGLDRFRQKYGERVEKAGGKLTVTAILLKVSASALRVFPKFNASIDIERQEIIYKKYYHIGVAVDTDRGLIVPVIRDVDTKNITELSVELTRIAEKTRTRKITPDELEGGTFTVSNLGGIGGTHFSPIVYAPQVAILGVARARTEPVYIEGRFEPRLVLPLSVSYDHRIIDGADGARFLRWVAEALEEPLLAWLEG